jgi:hypothetical protein
LPADFFDCVTPTVVEMWAMLVIIATPSAAGDPIRQPARPQVTIAVQPATRSKNLLKPEIGRTRCGPAIGMCHTRKGTVSPTAVSRLPDYF